MIDFQSFFSIFRRFGVPGLVYTMEKQKDPATKIFEKLNDICCSKLRSNNSKGFSNTAIGLIKEETASAIEDFRSINQPFLRSVSLKKYSKTSQPRKAARTLLEWVEKGTKMATGTNSRLNQSESPFSSEKSGDSLLYLMSIVNTAIEEIIAQALELNHELGNVLRNVWELHWFCFDWLVFGVLKETSESKIQEELKYAEIIRTIEVKINKKQEDYQKKMKRGTCFKTSEKETQSEVSSWDMIEAMNAKKLGERLNKKKRDFGTDCCYLIQIGPKRSIDFSQLKNSTESTEQTSKENESPKKKDNWSFEQIIGSLLGFKKNPEEEFESREKKKEMDSPGIFTLKDLEGFRLKRKKTF